MKARVIDKDEGILKLVDDPAASHLEEGEELNVSRPGEQAVRPFRTIRGLWKGTRISPEHLAEVREEMHTSLTSNGGD